MATIIRNMNSLPIKKSYDKSTPLKKGGNDKKTPLYVKYTQAMEKRYLIPLRSAHLNEQKAIVSVGADDTKQYYAPLPVWTYDPTYGITRQDFQRIVSVLQKIVSLGIVTHPAMRQIMIRRLFYQDLVNGKIYHFHKENYITLHSQQVVAIKRHMKGSFPGFVEWCMISDGKKVKLPKETLQESLGVVNPHSWEVVTGVSVVMIGYLVNKYMELQATKAKAPLGIVKKAVRFVKDSVISMVRMVEEALISIFESTVDFYGKEWKNLLLLHAVGGVAMTLYTYLGTNPTAKAFVHDLVDDPSSTVVEPHGKSSYGPLAITTAISAIVLPTIGLNVLRNYKSISHMYNDMGGVESALETMKKMVNVACELCGRDPWYKVLDNVSVYQKIVDDCYELLNLPDLEDRVAMDETLFEEIGNVEAAMLDQYRTVIADKSLPQALIRDFTNVKSRLSVLKSRVIRANKLFIARPVPKCVMFTGPPGQGKSELSSGIAAAVFKLIHGKEIKETDKYTKNKATPYWDGYSNQWALFLPEFLQSTLPNVNCIDATDFLTMIDDKIMGLNMSGVEQKGKFFLTSKIVFGDTNSLDFKNTGITDVNAIRRRIHFPFTVERGSNVSGPDDLRLGWKIRFSDDYKQHKRSYLGVPAELRRKHNNTVFTVVDVIGFIVNSYKEEHSRVKIVDYFNETDWLSVLQKEQKAAQQISKKKPKRGYVKSPAKKDKEKETDEVVSSSSSDSGLEAVIPHGWFSNDHKAVEDFKYWFPDKVMIEATVYSEATWHYNDVSIMHVYVYIALPAGKLSRFSKRTGIVVEYNADVSVYAAVKGKLSGIQKDTYKIPSSSILAVIKSYAGVDWSTTHSCQHFVRDMIIPHYSDYTMTILESEYQDRGLVISRSNVISPNDYYNVPWYAHAVKGKQLMKEVPLSDDGNYYYPKVHEEYMMRTGDDGEPFLHKLLTKYEDTNLKIVKKGISLVLKKNSQMCDVIISESSYKEYIKDDKAKGLVMIGHTHYLVDLRLSRPSSLFAHALSYVGNVYVNTMPNCMIPGNDTLKTNKKHIVPLTLIGVGGMLAFATFAYKVMIPGLIRMGSMIWEVISPTAAVATQSIHRNLQFNLANPVVAPHGANGQRVSVMAKYASRIRRANFKFKTYDIQSNLYFINSRVAAVTAHTVFDSALTEIEILSDGMTTGHSTDRSEFTLHAERGREVTYIVFKSDKISVKDIKSKLLYRTSVRKEYDNIITVRRICDAEQTSVTVSQKMKTARSLSPLGLYYKKSVTLKDGTTVLKDEIRNVNDYFRIQDTGMREGDCGTPYLINVGNDCTLLGIHYGMLNSMAYLAPIYYEDVPDHSGLNYDVVLPNASFKTLRSTTKYQIPGIDYVGTIDRPLPQSTKVGIKVSPLLKTALYGVEGLPPLNKAPATLWGPATELAFRYYLGMTKPLPPVIRQFESKHPGIFAEGFITRAERKCKALSFEEAILGSSEKHVSSLDVSTATGPSISLGLIPDLPRTNKRGDFFNLDEKYISPDLLKVLYANKSKAEKLTAIVPLVGDLFKVEMRPLLKQVIIDGKTYIKPRVFGCTDLLALIEHKSVFGEMCVDMHRRFSETSDLVGINPYSYAWQRLKMRSSLHPNIFGIDIKGCDASHDRNIQDRFFQFANKYFYMYNEGTLEYNRLRCACATLNSVYHIFGDNIFLSTGKNPSGCLLTCLINAFFIYTKLSQIFYILQYQHLASLELRFDKEVVFSGFGDDSITAVSDKVAPWFNRNTIFPAMKEYFGVICTAPNKEETVTDFDTWETIDLLKRKFVTDGMYTWAPIEEESILQSLYYLKKTPGEGLQSDIVEHYEQVLRSAATEYALHGEDKFNWFVSQFKKRYEEIGGVWKVLSYEEEIGRLKSAYRGSDYDRDYYL